MAEYRVNLMGSEGHFESPRTFVCDTDENAIVWAREMAGEQPAELWVAIGAAPRPNRRRRSRQP